MEEEEEEEAEKEEERKRKKARRRRRRREGIGGRPLEPALRIEVWKSEDAKEEEKT